MESVTNISPPHDGDLHADDFVLPFQVGDTAVRGRVVRMAGAIDDILSRHAFPDPVSTLVGEAVALVAMMGSALKFDGKLILQLQGDGSVPMVVADFSAGGALRATAKIGSDYTDDQKGTALVGKGQIVMTIDQGPDMERYQGVTPLDGINLGQAAVSYFNQSEQIPTAVRLAVGRISAPGEPERWRAGGVIAQFVPGEGGERERGEEILMADSDADMWERAAAFVNSTQDDELLDPAISAETLLFRLFHKDGVRVFDALPIRAECSCHSDKIEAVLSRYSEEDLAEMVDGRAIKVTCEFCRRDYHFTPQGKAMDAKDSESGAARNGENQNRPSQ